MTDGGKMIESGRMMTGLMMIMMTRIGVEGSVGGTGLVGDDPGVGLGGEVAADIDKV